MLVTIATVGAPESPDGSLTEISPNRRCSLGRSGDSVMLQEAADRQRAAAADGINITFYYLCRFPLVQVIFPMFHLDAAIFGTCSSYLGKKS